MLGIVYKLIEHWSWPQTTLSLRLQDRVYSWGSTAHAHGQLSMYFDLMRVVLLRIWRDLVTNVLSMDNAESDGAICWLLQIYRGESREFCTVLLNKGLFLKNWTSLATKPSIWPLSMSITVDLEHHLSLLVAWMVRFRFKSYQSLTVYVWPLMQGNLSVLTVKNTLSVSLFASCVECLSLRVPCFATVTGTRLVSLNC